MSSLTVVSFDESMINRSEDWLRTAEERQFQRRIWKEIVAELGDMVPELWRL